jgi:hypothetical protein
MVVACSFTAILLVIVGVVSSRTDLQREKRADVIVCDPAFLVFEGLPNGQRETKEIRISNSADHAVIVQQVKASCGCTETRLSSSRIQPKSFVTLAVTMEGSAPHGAVQHTQIEVATSNGNDIIDIEQRPISGRFKPDQFDFGNVDYPGSQTRIKGSLLLPSDLANRPMAIRVLNDKRIAVVSSKQQEESSRLVFILQVAADAAPGEIAATLRASSPSGERSFDASIFGYIRGPYFADPKALRVELNPNSPRSVPLASITLRSSAPQATKVAAIIDAKFQTPAPPCLEASVVDGQTVLVSVADDIGDSLSLVASPKVESTYVILTVDDVSVPELLVPISVRYETKKPSAHF